MKKLSDLGERKAIQLIFDILSSGNAKVEIGDDCAVLEIGNEYLLVTTDMITRRTHILKEMTPYQLGWFIVAINLSDIAAKGGTPTGLVLSYGLPKETSEAFLKQMTKGADACATQFGTNIVGGDTKEASEITLCGTAFGTVKKEEFMPRIGLKPGDIVAVTGTLGKAGAGYYYLKNKIMDKDISKALFEPVPKLKEGRILAREKCVTSSIDISDGLSSSLYQLKELNNAGFEINQSSIPLSSALIQLEKMKKDFDGYKIALHFGGDYELLVTIPMQKFEKAKGIMEKHGAILISIGKVIREKKVLIVDGKSKKTLEDKGYEHFKKHLL